MLANSGGQILVRQIPRLDDFDAIGCYPIFSCTDWSKLSLDLETIKNELVTLALVSDCFGNYTKSSLQEHFDVVIPFKNHYVVRSNIPLNKIISRHHRYYARKSLRTVSVKLCPEPELFLDEWVELYQNLIERHQLVGLKAFSTFSFTRQFQVPGIVMFRVLYRDTPVGAQIWYTQQDIAYSHLTVMNPLGYKLRASYALYMTAIEYFFDRVKWIDLGAGAGIKADINDGLSIFKRGWANQTQTTFFCGRIFKPERYSQLIQTKPAGYKQYFPAYRFGEFT